MKTIPKITVIAISLVLMLIADLPFLSVPLVPEAHAILGVWRRHARRWAVVGTAAVATTATAAAATEAAADQQQAAAAQQQTAAPPPAVGGKPLPLGTVVAALPAGCTSTPVGGVEYHYCGGNFYRAVFQGNSLVYVTAQPK